MSLHTHNKINSLKKVLIGYSFEKNIFETKTKLSKMNEIRKRLNYISEIENWISKKFVSLVSYVEKNVMIKLKLEFSKIFAEWFNMLVSESFNVYLKEDFTPVIEQQDYEIDYAYLSGGENCDCVGLSSCFESSY